MELKRNEINKIRKQLEGDNIVIEVSKKNHKGFVEVKFKHQDARSLYLNRKQNETINC